MDYYITIEHQKVPVSKEIFQAWHRGERKERYFSESDFHNGVYSYDALDTEDLNGSELFADPSTVTVENAAIQNILSHALPQALKVLNAEEKELILRLYFDEESLRQVASRSKIPLSTLSYRHKQALKKLENYFEHTFSASDK